jgi:hypothetical protein
LEHLHLFLNVSVMLLKVENPLYYMTMIVVI